MRNVIILLSLMVLLVGCAESIALLSSAQSGKFLQSSVKSTVSYGIKKTTGKTPLQHVLAYADVKNPNKKKEKCISFIKKTNSEACMIINKQIASTKAAVVKKMSLAKVTTVKKRYFLPTLKEKKIFFSKKDIETKIDAVEKILKKNVMNKNQIDSLQVSINKNFKSKNLRN